MALRQVLLYGDVEEYNQTEEDALALTLDVRNAGKIIYNTTLDKTRIWNGTAFATTTAGGSGVQGSQGSQGSASTVPGPTGPTGPTGVGERGSQGSQGSQGSASTVPGPTGPTGPTGVGERGSQGSQGSAGVGGASTIKLTADLAANTVGTAAICTGMALSVTAGSYYFFRFNVLYQAAVTTTGIKLGLTFPAVTSFAGTVIALNSGAASVVYGRITTSGGLVTGAGTPVANTTYMAEILGSILPSANGTIQVTYGTEVGGSAVTVKQGSNGLLFTL